MINKFPDSGTFQTCESRSTQTNPEPTNLLIQLAKEFESIVQDNPELNQFPLLGDDDISPPPWNPGETSIIKLILFIYWNMSAVF